MAFFKYSTRGILTRPQRFIHLTSRQQKLPKKLIDPWDLMTGKELWEAIQHKKGNYDPFMQLPVKAGPGTKECPNVIYSFDSSRLVSCHCTPDSPSLKFFWVHEGYPRRCYCNYWFVLERVDIPKSWYEDE